MKSAARPKLQAALGAGRELLNRIPLPRNCGSVATCGVIVRLVLPFENAVEKHCHSSSGCAAQRPDEVMAQPRASRSASNLRNPQQKN